MRTRTVLIMKFQSSGAQKGDMGKLSTAKADTGKSHKVRTDTGKPPGVTTDTLIKVIH